MATFRDLLGAAKAEITEVDTSGAAERIAAGATVLDVREPDEYDQGAIPGALHLPRGNLEFQVEGRIPDKSAPVIIYCAGGVRSAFAAQTMEELGYADVASMIGGFNRWKDEGRAWRVPPTYSPPIFSKKYENASGAKRLSLRSSAAGRSASRTRRRSTRAFSIVSPPARPI